MSDVVKVKTAGSYGGDAPPSQAVLDAEQGLANAEQALAADPNNKGLQDEVKLRRTNLEKARRK